MPSREQLLAELDSVRRAIAAACPPRVLCVRHVATCRGTLRHARAVLHLAEFGPVPEVGEVIEARDAAGNSAVFKVTGTRGLLALGEAGCVHVTQAKPLPKRLLRLRERERELVALTTVQVAVYRPRSGHAHST